MNHAYEKEKKKKNQTIGTNTTVKLYFSDEDKGNLMSVHLINIC